MSNTMSVDECKAHIQEIRRSHGADASNESERFLRRGFENMLNMLSEQLYTDPSHFLFELIQNADDNTYDEAIQPEVTLAYRSDGLFLFGCNEVGFSKANINAICDINQSTKTLLKEGKKSCIGEKGIGFKAVFKVASQVWISSNNYSFMFDKTKPLGMVDPIWAEFPDFSENLRSNTMICLEIEKPGDRDVIKEHLTKVMEPTSFMFLRRIRRIRVARLDTNSDVSDEITLSHEQRPVNDHLNLVTTAKTARSKTKKSTFVVSDYHAQEMPATEQRTGVTETLIKLAFPIDDGWQPQLAKQDAYAFLPVCSSGLPFLIQADFLLVASRQGIDESQPWNRRLQDKLVNALIKAFQRLNETSLRYLWPAYLPTEQVPLKFFEKMMDKLLPRLQDTKVLESRSGEVSNPKVMLLVPEQYKDEAGTPLVTPLNDRYLSTKYDPSHVSTLVTQALDGKRFFEMLKNFVSKQEEDFHNRPDSWHGKVCAVLMIERKQFNLDELLVLPVIPLDDGSWIQTKSRTKQSFAKAATRPVPTVTFYLPNSDANIVIPKGVSLSIIEHYAAMNEERRSFFRQVGARDLDYEDVLKGIIKQHKDEIRDADVDLLVSHAQYVFSLPSASRLAQNLSTTLWLADTRGTHCRGVELHVDIIRANPPRAPVSQYFTGNPNVVHFIHPKYLEAYRDDVEQRQRWGAWLRECVGLNFVPRLANRLNKDLSVEFQWMVSNLPSRVWLACLKDNWDEYMFSKAPKLGDARIPSQEVRDRTGNLLVDCTNGTRAKLKDTILPYLRTALTSIPHTGFQFLDVTNEHDNDWLKFSHLGVITTRDLNFSIKLLVRYSQLGHQPDKMTVIKLYRDMQTFCEPSMSAREAVRTAFKNYPLVYLSGTWVYLKACVWEAPRCLLRVRPIVQEYGPCMSFFKNYLNLRDAGIDDFVAELAAHENDILIVDRIKEMLLELSIRLSQHVIFNPKPLEKCRIFPVIAIDGQRVLMADNDMRWFIPDGRNLKASFSQVLPLLDLSQGDQKKLEPLLDKMGIWERHLSARVIKHEIVHGKEEAVRNVKYTKMLQGKVHYLLCLTNPDERYKMRPLLQSIEIWAVKGISVRRSVKINNQEIRGKDMPANIVLGKDQRVFVPIKDLESHQLNYYELSEKLATLCKLENVPEKLIIGVLSMPSYQQIEDMLEENGIIFDKFELRQLSSAIVDDSAGVMLPCQRGQPQTALQDMTVDGGPSLPDEMSPPPTDDGPPSGGVRRQQRSLKAIPVPLDHDLRAAPEKNGKNQQARGRSPAKPSAGERSDSGSQDDRSTYMPASIAFMGGLFRGGTGSGSYGRSSRKFNSSVAVSDDDLRDIDSEEMYSESGSSEGDGREDRGSSSNGCSRSGTPGPNMLDDAQVIRIGEQGEMKMCGFLKNILGEYFTDEMWTSHTAAKYTKVKFDGDDSQFSDFTILDRSGRLTEWFAERGCEQAKNWKGQKAITYHVEVKTTYGPRNEAFHMSQNQIDMAGRYCIQGVEVPSTVYVVMRVSQLAGDGNGGNAQVHPYVDPYALFAQGSLTYMAPQGYLVFSGRQMD